MAKISELTGEAREQRIAELMKRMQESAIRVKAAHASGELTSRHGAPAAVAVAEAEPMNGASADGIIAQPVAEAVVAENGAAVARPAPTVAPAPAAPKAKPKPTSEEAVAPVATPQEMNRREFLTYAWGAAMGLLVVESGVAVFEFLYPLFRAGEFGGDFTLPVTDIPDKTAAPKPYATGKFWLVDTQEGKPKALYMVCVHLGCLYKWEPSNIRFECPCHGSKYSHDGFYIEGPAPRSLDSFETEVQGSQLIVHTGKKITGAPNSESPAKGMPPGNLYPPAKA